MVGLLAAFRARVTARGMTFTALAHASGVQPGNLRRMFTSTTGSPRLGSVMRLLAPLHARIAPAGARTAAELTAFLDGLRRRSALDWEQVLGVTGSYAGKVAARLESDPEQLSLDVVMRLADALHIELELVDDDAPTIHPRERSMTNRSRASRQGQAPLGEPGCPSPSASVSVPVLPGEPLVQPLSSAAAASSSASSVASSVASSADRVPAASGRVGRVGRPTFDSSCHDLRARTATSAPARALSGCSLTTHAGASTTGAVDTNEGAHCSRGGARVPPRLDLRRRLERRICGSVGRARPWGFSTRRPPRGPGAVDRGRLSALSSRPGGQAAGDG